MNIENLARKVEAEGGLYTTVMSEVRDAYGANRLGVQVRANIHDELLQHGLGHIPDEVPYEQSDEVRLYKLGTPIAAVIEGVQRPSRNGDRALRSVHDSATDVLKRVRELVCE